VNGVCSLVRRVAGTSLEEIDNMIVELQKLRVFLVSEGERLQRELADYGKLTKAALRSMRWCQLIFRPEDITEAPLQRGQKGTVKSRKRIIHGA
jgi:hypothetical protein